MQACFSFISRRAPQCYLHDLLSGKKYPTRGFELLPEVLELLVPHVVVGEDIGAAVLFDGVFDLGDHFALAL